MLININDVLAQGIALDTEVSGDELREMALGSLAGKKSKTLGFSFLTPVSVHLEFSRLDENLVIVGTLKTTLGLECGSCTKDFPYDVSSDFTYCSPIEQEESDEEQSLDDALEALSAHIEGTDLDVTALVLEQISLEVPIKPLCTLECKGLCPRCGTDLNESSCECAGEEKVDPRLAALKEFRAKK